MLCWFYFSIFHPLHETPYQQEGSFYFFTFLLFYRFPSPLILLPEGWCEDHEYGKDFQTADEHHERAEPLGQIGQFAPRHGGSNLCSQGRSYVSHATQRDGDGIGVVDSHRYHRERDDDADDEIDM